MKLGISTILVVGLLVPTVIAQVTASEKPDQIKNIGVDEKLNQQIDANLTFLDSDGNTVALKDYLHKDRPVVLNLVYYSCPLLCGFVLQGVVRSLKDVPYTVGKDIEVITVSFDTKETPELAKAKKESILKDYGRPEAAAGWHVLVDKDGNAKKLADQIGFKYEWSEQDQQFAHASVTMLLTPEGKVSRYLYGIDHEARTLRLALTEASQGKIGTTVDRFLLFCYHYDPQSRSYVLFARNVMKIGGVLVMLLMGTGLFIFWRREMRGQGGKENAWNDESERPA
ncbi:MAG TPA: SCO family protein [Blastocatellia bacterium]|nr:SCO family protein [Blastocatellia bacterium]